MKSDQVEKKIMEVDNEEFQDLIQLDEYVIEDDKVDIPGFDRTVPVRTGVRKIPEIGAIFKVKRNSKTLKILEDWYYKKQTKDITIKRVDGAGNEFARELWPNTELRKCHAPAYDASSPVAAQVVTTFLPEDIIPISAEG